MSQAYEYGLPKKYRNYEDNYKKHQHPDFYIRKFDKPNLLVAFLLAATRIMARKTLALMTKLLGRIK